MKSTLLLHWHVGIINRQISNVHQSHPTSTKSRNSDYKDIRCAIATPNSSRNMMKVVEIRWTSGNRLPSRRTKSASAHTSASQHRTKKKDAVLARHVYLYRNRNFRFRGKRGREGEERGRKKLLLRDTCRNAIKIKWYFRDLVLSKMLY